MNSHPPTIQVKDAVIENNASFHTYTLAGTDEKGEFYARRRFSDFLKLREGMVVEWPGCYIPSLPDKKLIGYKQPKFVQHRRRFLQYFCSKLAGIPHLYWSEHFQLMIRHPDHQIEKAFAGISQKPTSTIVRRYRQLFGESLHKIPLVDLKSGIMRFHEYIKKAEKTLKALQSETQQLAESKRAYEACLTNCQVVLLPGYEQDFLVGYLEPTEVDPNLTPLTYSPDVVASIRSFQSAVEDNSLELLVDMIELELRELEVMGGLVGNMHTAESNLSKFQKMRSDCQSELSKLMSGKSTFKSVFNFTPKQAQIRNLELNIESLHYEIDSTQSLIEFITLIVGGIEIQRFKTTKRLEYYENVKHISKKELGVTVLYGSVLRSIAIALEPLDRHIQVSARQFDTLMRKPSQNSSPLSAKNSQSDEVESCHMEPQPTEF